MTRRLWAETFAQLLVNDYSNPGTFIYPALTKDKFSEYISVMQDDFQFGLNQQAIILSQIYPIEKFFGSDYRPEIIVSTGKVSGKPTTKDLSLRRFRKILGVVPVRDWSGSKKVHYRSGSILAMNAFWSWCFVRVDIESGYIVYVHY
ncbi:MAG: hypothetical protein F6K40_06070 [Okeania sp. SIO3I5]|uniref:hypothetical protein n=1 Tax=Okeania sp. SIO3I5 TaxID=2607805 RepID=UPI0013B8CBAE|nr:hypothetical protein [Okeania sp. SIO3I5]NEQ35874.1 hypothetical protein [Okeania sp. SIO3I5]